ncbi:MAG: universal stress protein [Myxococcota bacterium]
MTEQGTVLCATDLGMSGATALAWASAFARSLQLRLKLLHVDGAEFDTPAVPDKIRAAAMALTGRLEERRKAHEAALAENAKSLDLHCELVVTTGRPWEETLRVAEAEKASLIVVGPHDSGLGSTARRIITHAKIPVLAARGVAPRDLSGCNWVIGVPFEEDVPVLVQNIDRFASKHGGSCTLVRAVTPAGAAALSAPLAPAAPLTGLEEFVSATEAHLDTIAARLECPARVHVAHGDPEDVIDEAASEGDILAVAAHERGALERFFLGSVTERLLRKTAHAVYVEPAAD